MPAATQFNLSKNRLDENGGAPLYQQIYDLFKKQIISGDVEKNAHLPSEQELTELFGVSRITVRRALNELAASGLVKRQRGRGTVVTFNAAAPTVTASFDTLIEGLTRLGAETDVKLMDCRLIRPAKALADMMDLEKGEKVQRIVRLRSLNEEPFSYLITHIPAHVAADYDERELATASLIKMLEQSGHRPRAATQTITAVSAEAEIAAALHVAPGMPLLQIHRLMRDEHDKVVQEITAHYRADRFQYQMDLVRRADANWSDSE